MGIPESQALRSAAEGGDAEEVRRLLASGVAAKARDPAEWTALMRAAWFGHGECVDRLLPVSDAGARDLEGRTAADHARECGREDVAVFLEGYARSLEELEVLDRSVPGPKDSGKPKSAGRRL